MKPSRLMFLFGIVLATLFFSTTVVLSQDEVPLELSVDPGTRITQVYVRTISKEAQPLSVDATMGETVSFIYDIVVGDAFSHEEYWLYGMVFVYNPMPVTRNFTISALIGGSLSPEFMCFDRSGAETFSVQGESTTECHLDIHGLSGREYDGQEVVVTVTTTDNSPGVTSTASWIVDWNREPWVRRPSGPVTVVDDAQEPFVDTTWEWVSPETDFFSVQNYTCPSDASLYQNGQYSLSLSNTASVVEHNQTVASDTVTVTINCFSEVVEECTYGHGYWARHGADGPAFFDDAWLNIGSGGGDTLFFRSGQSYYEVLSTAPAGNPYYQLARAYIAAKLNILNGATPTQDVIFAIAFGDEIFYTYSPTDTLPSHIPDLMREFAATLNDFNNGSIGPGPCNE